MSTCVGVAPGPCRTLPVHVTPLNWSLNVSIASSPVHPGSEGGGWATGSVSQQGNWLTLGMRVSPLSQLPVAQPASTGRLSCVLVSWDEHDP